MGVFAYLDVGGSGIESVAHFRDNGRTTVMFASFEGPPKILRFFGHGGFLEPGQPGWHRVVQEIDPTGAASHRFHAVGGQREDIKLRNLVLVDIRRIRDSCGYGVPQFEYVGDRNIFPERYIEASLETFENRRAAVNSESIDRLPGLPRHQHASAFVINPSSLDFNARVAHPSSSSPTEYPPNFSFPPPKSSSTQTNLIIGGLLVLSFGFGFLTHRYLPKSK